MSNTVDEHGRCTQCGDLGFICDRDRLPGGVGRLLRCAFPDCSANRRPCPLCSGTVVRVDIAALRAALATLEAHEDLVVAAMTAEAEGFDKLQCKAAHDRVVSALYAIVDDGWRSPETPRS